MRQSSTIEERKLDIIFGAMLVLLMATGNEDTGEKFAQAWLKLEEETDAKEKQ